MGALTYYLQKARQRTLDSAPHAGDFCNRFYSGTSYALWKVATPLTESVRGLVLDAGSGRGGWKQAIVSGGATRESVDVCPREDLTWTADLTEMPQVPATRYDAVVCHQVLEHVRDPQAALAEIARVLKPGGRLVISVPHLSRLHELPHDYFRFTPNGLEVMLQRAGFEVSELAPYGGLLTFVHHQASTLVLGLAALCRPLFLALVGLNAPICMMANALDRLVDRKGLLANGVVAVATRAAPPGAIDG